MADTADTQPGETPADVETTAPATNPEPESQEPDEEPFDKDRAMATIRKLRQEAKQAGVTARERDQLKAALQKVADDQLSEHDRLAKRATALEAELAFEKQEKQDRTNRYEVQIAANRLGIVDADAAVKLLDWASLEYGDDGRPRDIDRALKLLIKERPYLAGTPASAATNTGNPGTRTGTAPGQRFYTRSELADYEFYGKHRDDIQQAMRDGRILD